MTGGKVDASMTTRLSEGAGSGKVARPSTRTNLPSCAETMMSAHSAAGDATRPRHSNSPPGMFDRNECIAVLLVVAYMCCRLSHNRASPQMAALPRTVLIGYLRGEHHNNLRHDRRCPT